ncbi:MAG TPA: alpha/beta hydrolase, partial [Smithella sp.]|nr:alpha/beta hydrolase [Smithella sp.]
WKMEFIKNDPENPDINYLRNPVSGSYELEKLMKRVDHHLKNIADPVLIIQASNDPVVDPCSGRDIFNKIGGGNKQFFMVNANHHGILRGKEATEVHAKVLAFLSESASK